MVASFCEVVLASNTDLGAAELGAATLLAGCNVQTTTRKALGQLSSGMLCSLVGAFGLVSDVAPQTPNPGSPVYLTQQLALRALYRTPALT